MQASRYTRACETVRRGSGWFLCVDDAGNTTRVRCAHGGGWRGESGWGEMEGSMWELMLSSSWSSSCWSFLPEESLCRPRVWSN